MFAAFVRKRLTEQKFDIDNRLKTAAKGVSNGWAARGPVPLAGVPLQGLDQYVFTDQDGGIPDGGWQIENLGWRKNLEAAATKISDEGSLLFSSPLKPTTIQAPACFNSFEGRSGCRRSRRETRDGPAAMNGSPRSARAAGCRGPEAAGSARPLRSRRRRRVPRRFQRLPAPEPDLRHVESTVYLELAEAAGGERDFQREIGKLFFPVDTPRFIRLRASLLERFAHRGLTARHDFDAGFLEINGH